MTRLLSPRPADPTSRGGRHPAAVWRRVLGRRGADLRQGFAALLLSSAGDLVAGVALGSMTDTLQRLPGLLILVPAAIGMRGNIFGALGARLGTATHTGAFTSPRRAGSPAGQSVAAAGLLTVYISAGLGALAWATARLLAVPHISLAGFVVISMLGGLASSVVVGAVTVGVASLAARRGWDLDNVATPVVTAAGDLVTLPALWAASFAVTDAAVTDTLAVGCAALVAAASGWQARRRVLRVLQQVVTQSVPLLLVAGLIDVIAGYVLDRRTERFFALPALLVLVPPFLEDAGALGGILSARLASKLHLGTLTPRLLPGRASLGDVAVIAVLAVPVFTLVAASSFAVSAALGIAHPGLGVMIGLALLAGAFATTGAVFIAYYAGIITYRAGLDPDNYGIPIITSSTDLIGSVSLIAAVLILGLA